MSRKMAFVGQNGLIGEFYEPQNSILMPEWSHRGVL